MHTIATRALALAGTLILAGCATKAWQPPAHHPADPQAAAGSLTGITALERYRAGAQPANAQPQQAPAQDAAHERPHHDQGEAHR